MGIKRDHVHFSYIKKINNGNRIRSEEVVEATLHPSGVEWSRGKESEIFGCETGDRATLSIFFNSLKLYAVTCNQ